MMLHIGCGASRIDAFVNIDCRETPAADLVTPAWDLRAFEDASVAYIYARHMLEHMSLENAVRSLAEWRRVLRVGGIVHIVVPDIIFHAKQLLGVAQCPHQSDQRGHALAGFYGWQRPDCGEADFHRWGYTPDSLKGLLTHSGFEITGAGIAQLTARDREPWHINMRARKRIQ
jgi:predicted SAM-dependent methyltransferase